jgi:Cu/Ag efflux protein CusF
MKAAGAVALLILAAACQESHSHGVHSKGDGAEYYRGVGRYLFHSTEGSRAPVTINHEEIPGFMDAMAMPYLIQDLAVVEGLEPGQEVEFRVVVEGDGFYFVDRINPISGGPQ